MTLTSSGLQSSKEVFQLLEKGLEEWKSLNEFKEQN